ncbi:protein kinase, putative [Trichophyton benhamiae CBS 112371]|uniref:non-specific serine/threonine protein kinase n=1 Tax=Arthroderma benhamiae (strain ATCC MYA-4681 / CBS 112371) TaxID=663331 RepID=D4B539_ARTBC|nr:protein kinase, putative [Trichophyton benhamiae CBS 112371]EFE29587.1 protein kinase, putative [Trichophyton benhamiae CBS 112371]
MDRLIENIPDMGFDIWCDDSFLTLTGPPDAPLPPQPHENPQGAMVYWDNRPLEVNGQAWVLMPVPKCDEDLQAFHMDGGHREIIVLCPKMFEHYLDLGDYQIDMTSRPPTFSRGIHIDSFATSLMFVLVHEVSHCDYFLQGLATSDIPADADGYGWQEAVRHADNNHLYALENAAMFLSNNDWSTGLSDDMFADAPAREFPPSEWERRVTATVKQYNNTSIDRDAAVFNILFLFFRDHTPDDESWLEAYSFAFSALPIQEQRIPGVATRFAARRSIFVFGTLTESTPSATEALYHPESDVEDLEGYRPGGYHPTLAGDSFCDGRYAVVHKHRSGGYSTIWLARDQQLQRYVSLKILVAGASQDTHESKILQLLSKGNLNGPGKQFIPSLLHQFSFDGPNGHHQCLVGVPTGCSVASSKENSTNFMFPPDAARSLAAQLIMGVAYLHSNDVCHREAGGTEESALTS